MSDTNEPQKNIYFLTLGCAKNEVDTRDMQERVLRSGYAITSDINLADAIVINTCSFIQEATEESIEVILDTSDGILGQKKPAKLIVSGCMPARYGNDLSRALPEVAAFLPCSEEQNISVVLEELFENSIQEEADNTDFTVKQRIEQERAPLGAMAEPSAYVKISEGCDRFCSYCTIPFIRGRYHSFTLKQILEETDKLIAQGAKELILIAQDTGRWGTDLETPSSLANLLEVLAQRYSDVWLRVMYIQPEGVSDELIEVVGKYANICPYFDIPIQHVNEDILKSMNRTGSREEFEALISRIRAGVPGAILRTTVIAGFPGEREEQFKELCDFIELGHFDYIGVFPYSQEENTVAAKQPCQVSSEVKLERAQILRDLADAVCVPKVGNRLGREYEVLTLGKEEDGQLFGRTKEQAPDVDGVVYLEDAVPGEFVKVRISDTLLYDMEGDCNHGV